MLTLDLCVFLLYHKQKGFNRGKIDLCSLRPSQFKAERNNMSITINTSDFINSKKVTIDGAELEFRPLTTAQSMALIAIKDKLQKQQEDKADSTETVQGLLDVYYSMFTPKEEAARILANLPVSAVADIIKRVSESDG